jgi:hypothetical protein
VADADREGNPVKTNLTIERADLQVILMAVQARVEWLRERVRIPGFDPDTLAYWQVSLERAEETYRHLISGDCISIAEEN